MKWLAASALVVVALLVLLWMELRAPEAVAAVSEASRRRRPPREAGAGGAGPRSGAQAGRQGRGRDGPAEEDRHRERRVLPRVRRPAAADPHARNAAKCYTGGLKRVHRNQKVKLSFINHIKNGVRLGHRREGRRVDDQRSRMLEMIAASRARSPRSTWQRRRAARLEAARRAGHSPRARHEEVHGREPRLRRSKLSAGVSRAPRGTRGTARPPSRDPRA